MRPDYIVMRISRRAKKAPPLPEYEHGTVDESSAPLGMSPSYFALYFGKNFPNLHWPWDLLTQLNDSTLLRFLVLGMLSALWTVLTRVQLILLLAVLEPVIVSSTALRTFQRYKNLISLSFLCHCLHLNSSKINGGKGWV